MGFESSRRQRISGRRAPSGGTPQSTPSHRAAEKAAADPELHLRSRNNNDFAVRYPEVLKGLTRLPDETVIDGEVVAFDESGRPSFNALQNYGSASGPVVY
jgi:hypothetical protein